MVKKNPPKKEAPAAEPADALAVEDKSSPFVNIIAAREADQNNPAYLKFVKIFQSEPVAQFIKDKFQGAFIVGW